MTFFLAKSAFLFLLITLHESETHSFGSLSQRLLGLLGPEAVAPHQPDLAPWEYELEDKLEEELDRSDDAEAESNTPPALEDAGDDNALIVRSSESRRRWPPINKKLISSCYVCNYCQPNWNFSLNPKKKILDGVVGIPNDSLCHDAWDPFHPSSMRMRRKFRTRCYLDPKQTVRLVEPIREPKRYDRGPMILTGNFTGGCFKRFLDFGEVYTARGCRKYNPMPTSGYASDRFKRLELLLRDEKDGCISSPHASLTPFSRGVSLYVHYHVCVCSSKYCNHAPSASATASFLLLVFSINLVI